MVNRIVVIAIRPRGGTEVNHGTRENGVHAPECGVAEGIVAGFVDETHRHTAGAGVGDGELRCRADAAPALLPTPRRPPVDGDILSAVQIDRRCRGVGTGQVIGATTSLAGRSVNVLTTVVPKLLKTSGYVSTVPT